jgi:hypothetical protein
LIINLVQAIYDQRISPSNDWEFYNRALEDIEFFAVSPQIYDLLKQRGLLEQTPAFFQNRLKDKYTEALYLNILIKSRTVQILKAFEAAEIQVIPLKGVLFAEKYFGHIGARPTSDIDLLVRQSDLDKAVNYVKSLGFTVEEEVIDSHFHRSFSQTIPGSIIPLTVEIHWDLLKENTSRFNPDELWNEAEPLEVYKFIKQLSEYHTFYMICLHGWRHNLNDMKYFIDIIQMIHYLNERLDYNVLLKDAAAHQTFKRISRTLSIVYREFPQLNDFKELPLKIKNELWWDYKAIRNLRPKSFKDYLNFAYYLCMDYDTAKHSLVGVRDWLLPSKSDISSELGLNHIHSRPANYFRLYKKRWINFFQTMMTNKTP